MKNRKLIPLLVYLVALILILSWLTDGFGLGRDDLSYTQIVRLFEEEQVKSFIIQGNLIELQLHGTYNGDKELLCHLGDPA